jgi:hypothetical protein
MFSAWSDSARGGFDDCGFLRELVTGSELLSAGTRQFFRNLDAIFSFRRFSGGNKFESNWDARRISQETTKIGKHETNNINNL